MSQYRVKVEVPYEVPCGTCDRSIQVRGDKTRTYRYRSGQSQLYCNLKCSSASKVGVKNPGLSERMKGNSYRVDKAPANKLNVGNPRFFQTIDTEEKAYYLGLIAADGSVKSSSKAGNVLSLSLIDSQPVYHLKELLGCEARVAKREYEYLINPMYCLNVGDKNIVSDLMSHGVVPNKTKILRFPSHLSDIMVRHFIRGYMDGDGDVCLINEPRRRMLTMSFYGTKDLVNGCIKHLDENVGLKSKGTFQQGTITRFKRSCKQAQDILEYLYKDSSVFFGRKNQKYLDWLEYRSIPQ
jgi:intein/homing endonuclease